MLFIPIAQQEKLTKVVVTTEAGHTTSKIIHPEPDPIDYTDRDGPEDDQEE